MTQEEATPEEAFLSALTELTTESVDPEQTWLSSDVADRAGLDQTEYTLIEIPIALKERGLLADTAYRQGDWPEFRGLRRK
jgi:hypothetical protein